MECFGQCSGAESQAKGRLVEVWVIGYGILRREVVWKGDDE
jgi:hypothetical protein